LLAACGGTSVTSLKQGSSQCPYGGLEANGELVCNSPGQLVVTKQLAIGDSHCAGGGTEIDTGASNGDGGFVAGSVTVTYACNSAAVLTREEILAIGDAHCPSGGTEIDVGLDDGANGGTAGDGILESGEVRSADYVCDSQGLHVGSFTPPAGSPGSYTINLNGGSSDGGGGGNGAELDTYFSDYGSGGGHVKLFTTGNADAGIIVPTAPSAVLGTLPLTIGSSMTLQTLTYATPPLWSDGGAVGPGTVYASSPSSNGQYYVYYWDGGTVGQMTGVSVAPNVTLTVTSSSLYVPNGFQNAGKVTTTPQGSDLSINAETFVGLAGSTIDLSGQVGNTTNPGGGGGTLSITANLDSGTNPSFAGGGIYNAGAITTAGGNGQFGGGAGSVDFFASNGIFNSGAIQAMGGAPLVSSNHGGVGGSIYFQDEFGSVQNTATLNSSGGISMNAGYIEFVSPNGGQADLRNSGNLLANGGDAVAVCSSPPCSAGSGGSIYLEGQAVNIYNTGDLKSYGGAASQGSGGTGGYLYIEQHYSSGSVSKAYNGTGNIQVSGNIDLHGGSGSYGGGNAGQPFVYNEIYGSAEGQEIQLLGYGGGIQSNGGSGLTNGGSGGGVLAYNSYGDALTFVPGGSVISNVNVSARGGNGTTSSGGFGGHILLGTQHAYDFPQHIEQILNSGALDTSGGSGATFGGNSGYIYMYGIDGVVNSGSLTANAGAVSGASATGGSTNIAGTAWDVYVPSTVALMSANGSIVNSGAISVHGGAETGASSAGGSSNGVQMVGEGVESLANISAVGGNGTSAGGNGGNVTFLSLHGTTTSTGTIANGAGTGTTPGTPGQTSIDGQVH
jgi:hypothetical protein